MKNFSPNRWRIALCVSFSYFILHTSYFSFASPVDGLSDAEVANALKLLRSSYVRSAELDEAKLNRAMLQGLTERLGGGAFIQPIVPPTAVENPFRSEILDEKIGYVRLGTLTKGRLAELDAALDNFKSKNIGSLILDLRATPASSDFELAAEFIKRFTPKGKMLFAVHRPGIKQEVMFTSDLTPAFEGVIVTLISRDTAGAPEVIAAVLRAQQNALTVGQRTMGQAAEYSEIPLRDSMVLRVAVAEVKLSKGDAPFPEGIMPDLPVNVSAQQQEDALQVGLEKGVAGLVYETERPHMNEASLVAGTNPEIDEEAAAQQRSAQSAPLYDTVLQRAVDLVTTIRIFGGKK